jgi:hypothetical protein
MTLLYRIRVDGRVTDQAREAFCDMSIDVVPAGATFTGQVIDEAHLLGIMAQCRALGLRVVSAQRVPPAVRLPSQRAADAAPSDAVTEDRTR